MATIRGVWLMNNKPDNRLSEIDAKKRRHRSIAIALAIAAISALFFVVTLARLGANVLNRPL